MPAGMATREEVYEAPRCSAPKTDGGVLLLLPVLLLCGCGARASLQAAHGDTVSTALFDYSVREAEVLDSYPGIRIPEEDKLVRLWLVVKNTSTQNYTMFAQDFQVQWGDGEKEYGTCLEAVDETMMPEAYPLDPGMTHQGAMLVTVPRDCAALAAAGLYLFVIRKKLN